MRPDNRALIPDRTIRAAESVCYARQMMKRSGTFATALVLAHAAACSGGDRPPPSNGILDRPDDGAAGSHDGGVLFDVSQSEGPPAPDASGLCGNQLFRVAPEAPNLYFVLDRSGSMAESPPGQSFDKYTLMRMALLDVARTLGNRARFGVAVFPSSALTTGCEAGGEVFSTHLGDPPGDKDKDGPVTTAIATATASSPRGGTPTAETLAVLYPILTALQGKTAVVLATDGAPNCNLARTCTPAECTYNIEGVTVNGDRCTPSHNCCDPNISQGPGGLGCVDGVATTSAVQELRDAGIRTYVVGIPGSTYYGALLDQLATIGGSARPGSPRYYQVDDMTALSTVLEQIGTKELVTCDFVLDVVPPDRTMVNVYFDQEVVAYDETNGWAWTGDTTLSFRGEACAKLKSGTVVQVQVVAGCPTKQPA